MATPEGKVKAYLFKRVAELGGEARNVAWVGRKHCPDTFIMLPWCSAWIETKRLGEDARAGQQREIERLRKYGNFAEVLDCVELIDAWLLWSRQRER